MLVLIYTYIYAPPHAHARMHRHIAYHHELLEKGARAGGVMYNIEADEVELFLCGI